MLKGKNLILRALVPADIPYFNRWRADKKTKEALMLHPFPVSISQDNCWYDNEITKPQNKRIYFAIQAIGSEAPCGYFLISNINWVHRTCYTGIYLDASIGQGKGLGTEAANLAYNYIFQDLNLRKISVEILDDNEQSAHFHKKMGFVDEGCLRQQCFYMGRYQDVRIMSLFNQRETK